MTQEIHFVITNFGDGSNGVDWVLGDEVLDEMEDMAGDGDERYASGDGLQVTTLCFPGGFDTAAWLSTNLITVTTLDDVRKSR